MSSTKVITAASLPLSDKSTTINNNDDATPVKVTFWRPEMGDNEIFQERGRSRYRELYLNELECPLLREHWRKQEEQFVWGAPTSYNGCLEFMYNNRVVRVIIKGSKRTGRFKNIYGTTGRGRAKRNPWRWRRMADRMQKEHALRADTWFFLPTEDDDYGFARGDRKPPRVRVPTKKAQMYDSYKKNEKEKERRQRYIEQQDQYEGGREEWRDRLKRQRNPCLPSMPASSSSSSTTSKKDKDKERKREEERAKAETEGREKDLCDKNQNEAQKDREKERGPAGVDLLMQEKPIVKNVWLRGDAISKLLPPTNLLYCVEGA